MASYLLRPDHIIIAAVRDPSHATSQSLQSLRTGQESRLIILPLLGVSTSDTSAVEAIDLLKTKHNIKSLDLVIANAGIASYWGTALETPFDAAREHFNVNAIGALSLFRKFTHRTLILGSLSKSLS